MSFFKKIPLRRCCGLALAVAACALQVLSGSLPSLVVCYRADRPPRVEFFAGSCSCHREGRHPACDHEGHDTACLETACMDVPLRSEMIRCDPLPRFRAGTDPRRRVPGNGDSLDRLDPAHPRLPAVGLVRPMADAPPVLSVPPLSSRLRC